MDRHFDQDLDELKRTLLGMGGTAEAVVRKAVDSLRRRDATLADEVLAEDQRLDRLEIDIEERSIRLLALRQPLASDLRFITAALKISNDLERVGDHAVNIAGNAKRLLSEPPLPTMPDLPGMAELAAGMLRDALDAFVRGDAPAARRVCERDDAVDDFNRRLFGELVGGMISDPAIVTRAMELILVARNLERIADLATNVAEEVVFIAEARIIKHHVEETVGGTRPDDDFGRT